MAQTQESPSVTADELRTLVRCRRRLLQRFDGQALLRSRGPRRAVRDHLGDQADVGGGVTPCRLQGTTDGPGKTKSRNSPPCCRSSTAPPRPKRRTRTWTDAKRCSGRYDGSSTGSSI